MTDEYDDRDCPVEYQSKEVPLVEDDPRAAAQAIIEMMDMDIPLDSLEALLRRTRHAHRMVLSEWERRNVPDSQPPRRLPEGEGPSYDYGEDFTPTWEEWWKENWGKPPGNPGLFRGTNIPMPPLVAIYHLVNRYWRRVMRRTFNPDFGAQYSADTDVEAFELLKPDAQFFWLVAQDAGGSQYSCDLCGRVHDAYYKKLNYSFGG